MSTPSPIADMQIFDTNSPAEQAFLFQAALCRGLEAPFYAELFERCAEELAPGRPVAAIVGDWTGDWMRDFVPLRMVGGVHQLVLTGALPELSKHYPSTGGQPKWPEAWSLFCDALNEHRSMLREFLATTPQTNEIGRAAALAAGFHQVACEFGRPLRLRELGASAGLNLCWDRYAYQLGSAQWGERDGRPLIQPEWEGPSPRLSDTMQVESRAGCDLSPIDLRDPDARKRLEAYVWADQPQRLERLRAAIDLALADIPRLDACPAEEWVASELEARPPDVATVVYHSSFWAYLSDGQGQAIRRSLEEAGAQATRQAPVAWLRLEDFEDQVQLRLRMWPDGGDRTLALSQPHGKWLRWLDA